MYRLGWIWRTHDPAAIVRLQFPPLNAYCEHWLRVLRRIAQCSFPTRLLKKKHLKGIVIFKVEKLRTWSSPIVPNSQLYHLERPVPLTGEVQQSQGPPIKD